MRTILRLLSIVLLFVGTSPWLCAASTVEFAETNSVVTESDQAIYLNPS